MKIVLIILLVVNTVIFALFASYSYKTLKTTQENIEDLRISVDTTNVRLKGIKAALDDKLFGIISNLPKK